MKRTNDSDCVIAGVCGGIADEIGIDPIWVRGGLLLATIGSCGFPGGLIYVIAWMLMEEE